MRLFYIAYGSEEWRQHMRAGHYQTDCSLSVNHVMKYYQSDNVIFVVVAQNGVALHDATYTISANCTYARLVDAL